jgi:hypothetical protein
VIRSSLGWPLWVDGRHLYGLLRGIEGGEPGECLQIPEALRHVPKWNIVHSAGISSIY